jgi:putative spermidine/putrescine transport system permease protein
VSALGPWLRVYVIAMVVFIMAPLVVVVIAAFNSAEFAIFPPPGLSLRWIGKALTDPEFIAPLWSSTKLGLCATAGAAIVAVPAAILLARRTFPFKHEFEAFLLAPLTLPQIVLATGLLFFVNVIGLGSSFAGLLAGHVVITMPYMLRTVYGVYVGTNREIEEAAAVLGAGPVRTFFSVTLPMLRSGILAGGIFAFLISFDEVPIALLLTNTTNVTLPVSILSYLIYNYDPTVAAISTVQIAIVLVLLVALDRVFGLKAVMFSAR